MSFHRMFLIAFVAIGLFTNRPPPAAQEFSRPYSKQDAAWVIESPESFMQGQTRARNTGIRCTSNQRVGVWIESADAVTMQGITIAGCEVGVIMERNPAVSLAAPTAATRDVAPARHAMQDITVQESLIGYWLRGSYGTVTDGTLTNVVYGVVLSGDHYYMERIRVISPSKDGIMVLGNGNTIIRNTVDGAGQHGLNLIGQIPFTAPGVALTQLNETPASNIIQSNTLTNSVDYDLRQWPARCRDTWRLNTFIQNIAAKRSAWCLRELPPPED